jgi:hypothetical protein
MIIGYRGDGKTFVEIQKSGGLIPSYLLELHQNQSIEFKNCNQKKDKILGCSHFSYETLLEAAFCHSFYLLTSGMDEVQAHVMLGVSGGSSKPPYISTAVFEDEAYKRRTLLSVAYANGNYVNYGKLREKINKVDENLITVPNNDIINKYCVIFSKEIGEPKGNKDYDWFIEMIRSMVGVCPIGGGNIIIEYSFSVPLTMHNIFFIKGTLPQTSTRPTQLNISASSQQLNSLSSSVISSSQLSARPRSGSIPPPPPLPSFFRNIGIHQALPLPPHFNQIGVPPVPPPIPQKLFGTAKPNNFLKVKKNDYSCISPNCENRGKFKCFNCFKIFCTSHIWSDTKISILCNECSNLDELKSLNNNDFFQKIFIKRSKSF